MLLNDSVRRTPKTNPAAAVIKSKMACGMTTVAKSTRVATGSRFWRTMIATKIVRNEAVMSFKLRIEAKTVPIRKIVTPLFGQVLSPRQMRIIGTIPLSGSESNERYSCYFEV